MAKTEYQQIQDLCSISEITENGEKERLFYLETKNPGTSYKEAIQVKQRLYPQPVVSVHSDLMTIHNTNNTIDCHW